MMTFRLLTAADAPAFQHYRLQAVQTDPQAFLSTISLEETKPLEQFSHELVVTSLVPPFGYYGLFDDDQLAGYIHLGTTGLPKQKHIAFFYNLYIIPKYRGQHLSLSLCDQVLAQAKAHGIERIFANCLKANHVAQAFYQRLGFEVCGQRVKSVKDGDTYDDEVELVKVV